MRRAGAEPQRARTEPSVQTAPSRSGSCSRTGGNADAQFERAWCGSEINNFISWVLDRSSRTDHLRNMIRGDIHQSWLQQITDFMFSTNV